jgi:hypothetical protein
MCPPPRAIAGEAAASATARQAAPNTLNFVMTITPDNCVEKGTAEYQGCS